MVQSNIKARAGTRPRVAMVVASLDIIGGHGMQATILADRLRQEGYEVDVVPINPRFPEALQSMKRIPYVRSLVNEIFYLPSLLRLRHADVVHIFSASYWSFLLAPLPAIVAAKTLGKRVVLNYHSGEADDHLEQWGMLVHPWLKLADEIVVPSEYLRAVFAGYGYRTSVIRNIVDTSRFRFRERKPLQPYLLSTRNLESHYRVDNTIQAFAYFKEAYPGATLTIAGYGSEEERLRRLAASLKVSGIRFVGRVEPREIPGLYDEGDIFVNSSTVDNQPLSILEAFAAGLPVVTTGTGDISHMVRDGETGLIVPPGDPRAMAEALKRLVENPDQALAMARSAREEVEKYSWSEVRDAWQEVYTGPVWDRAAREKAA